MVADRICADSGTARVGKFPACFRLRLPPNNSRTKNAVDSRRTSRTSTGHIFALTNLPETVKGALFARYSRSAKSLRRLFLDEFHKDVSARRRTNDPTVGTARAEQLYARVFNEYGDDSVAQLGGAHIACEYVSNILTKVLERGRLMAYLEQSTRYVPYTDKLHGRFRYHVPAEIGHGALRDAVRPGRWMRRSRRTRG